MRKAVLFVMVCAVTLPVLATTCTYEFSGYITQITNPTAFPGIALNQPFTGTFSYTLMPANSTGVYNQTASLDLAIGSFSLSHHGETLVMCLDYPVGSAGKSDSFTFHASGTQPAYSYFRTGIYLQDSTRTALTSTAIPELLPYSGFSVAQFQFLGNMNNQGFSYTGAVNAITPVPEPCTLLILLSAVPLLGQRRISR